MSRFGRIIPMDEFKKKIHKILDNDDFPYEMPPKITKDLAKVNFDWENFEIEDGQGYKNYPCGYETLENGMPVFFINAGGDWETPLCLCLYFDGTSIRGYIPTDGNVWNKEAKCAYGSEDDGGDPAVMDRLKLWTMEKTAKVHEDVTV